MSIKTTVKKNTYLDSITLMTISTRANKIEHVKRAMIGMGTNMNLEVMKDANLYTSELDSATPGDLIIAMDVEEDADEKKIMEEVDQLFEQKAEESEAESSYRTIEELIENDEDLSIVVVSVNGQYAAREAMKVLEHGINVMLFSDNVPLEDEIRLKKYAHEQGLFLMGPDCGTVILNGVGLGFSNAVRRGNIGIVAASGTGSQEVSVQVHKMGAGISQLLGTGGRDLSKEVGGLMMLDELEALAEDDETDVIVLISKPGAKEVEEKILKRAEELAKPVVVYFIGGEARTEPSDNIHFVENSLDAAKQAVILSTGNEEVSGTSAFNPKKWEEIAETFKPGQKYVRGLFCGGTLCDEMIYAVRKVSDEVYSNISKDPQFQLKDLEQSEGHTFIDFGDDFFTQGRPHPMIDPTARIERVRQEAKDSSVAVLVLDFEIGYGSNDDPAGAMLPALKKAKEQAEKEGRVLEIIGYVLGTEEDPQNLEEQEEKLRSIGVHLASSNTELGEIVTYLIKGEK